jgi:hypothetical protein
VSEPPPPPRSGLPPEPVPLPPPRPTTRKGKPKKPKVKRRGIGTYLFGAVIFVILLAGAYQLYDSLKGTGDPKIGDHWHAALGIDICGTLAESAPAFENKAGTQTRAGIHSHGDGLIHIHPFVADEEGDNATIGLFFEYGGWEVDEEHLKLWGGLEETNGATCPDGRAAKVRWAVNGEEQSGNPSDYQPKDQDQITIAFLPDGDAIPAPPQEVLDVLPNPADVQQGG